MVGSKMMETHLKECEESDFENDENSLTNPSNLHPTMQSANEKQWQI